MKRVTTVVIGAGQCGLAMSRELSKRSIDHIVLERGQIGNSWRTGRWDSLRLLTPNWMNGLAGQPYNGNDPDGFLHVSELVSQFDKYAHLSSVPLQTETRVLSVEHHFDGYQVQTDQGAIACESVVIATGACAVSKRPDYASTIDPKILQLTPLTYKRPDQLPGGGVMVVGASASGLQIAKEVHSSNRQVTLAVGNHLRLPRQYRGKDILYWMHHLQIFDEPYTDVDELERMRRTPSLPLIGDPAHVDIDLSLLQQAGIDVVGRLAAISDGTAWFSGGLANLCTSADLKMKRLLDRIDEWITERGLDNQIAPAQRFQPVTIPQDPRLSMNLQDHGIQTIIWANGFRPDHSWLNLPVFDRKGRITHDGGVVSDGLYVMGLPYLRTSRSTHIDGAPRDARVLAQQLENTLQTRMVA